MASYIWKPSTISSWKKGIAFLAPDSTDKSQAPTITVSGKTYTGKYVNTNEGRHQWIFPSELASMSGLEVSYGGQTGKIESGSTSYEGSDITGWSARAKGSLGSAYSAGTEASGSYSPGSYGYAAYPAYLGGMFPSTALVDYQPIESAEYEYTDPFEFAQQYGELTRSEYSKNVAASKQYALDQLQTELEGLESYVPAAAALKRQETAIDNVFNQAQRTAQLQAITPEIITQLKAQGERATAYAEGRLPDTVQDRALELGVRSRAADIASAGGFGATSSVSRKASELMSAEQRLELSKYGDTLLTSNIGTKTATLLAPTEYSQAGSQISVTPSISGSQLQSQNISNLSNLGMIPASTALSSQISQKQFETNLQQTTNQFNASNLLTASTTNAAALNNFALTKFNYETAYAEGLATAAQTNINTELSLAQQEAYTNQLESYIEQARRSGDWSNVTSLATTLFGSGLASFLVDAFGGDDAVDIGDEDWADEETQDEYEYTTFDNTSDVTASTSESKIVTTSTGTTATTSQSKLATTTPSSYTASTYKTLTGKSVTDTQDTAGKALIQQALNIAGVTTVKKNGYIHVSTDSEGNKYYANPQMYNNNSTESTTNMLQSLYSTLSSLKVFNTQDSAKFEKMIGSVSSEELFSKLSVAKSKGDKAAFIEALTEAFV